MNAVEQDGDPRPAGPLPLSYASPADPLHPDLLAPDPEVNEFAIASLVCGLFACVPFIPGGMALMFGFAALRRSRGARPADIALALIGTTLGAISLAAWLLYLTGDW